MRRGTEAATGFGEHLAAVRVSKRLTMAQVAKRLGKPPATVSQVEKAQRVVQLEDVSLWADALEISRSNLRIAWLYADKRYPAPPIVRNRTKATSERYLVDLVQSLTGPERDRVVGYIESLIESRLSDSK